MSVQRYEELNVGGRFGPLLLATRLAEAGIFDSYVVYERDNRWCYAGGVLGEVTVDRAEVCSSWLGQKRSRPWTIRPLESVRAALDNMPIGTWSAYGWVTFEFAYACGDQRDLVGTQNLLHLVILHTEVLVDADHVVVRSADPAVLQQVLDLVAVPTTAPPSTATPVDVRAEGAARCQGIVVSAVDEIERGLPQKAILSRCVSVDFPVDMTRTVSIQGVRSRDRRGLMFTLV